MSIKYFHFYKIRVIFIMHDFFFFEAKSINYFYVKENTWPFERLEHYLEREIQGMLKSFAIRRNKKILARKARKKMKARKVRKSEDT